MKRCRELRFIQHKALEGQKRGVIVGRLVYVSPAIYSLLAGPDFRQVIESLELIESSLADIRDLGLEVIAVNTEAKP